MGRVSVVSGAEHPDLGPHTAVIHADAELVPGALARLAALLDDEPTTDVVHGDFEVHDDSEVHGDLGMASASAQRAFTPEFSPERLRHQPYPGPLLVARASVASAAFDEPPGSCHDAALRLAEHTDRWHRLPGVLAACGPESIAADPVAVAAHLHRIGVDAHVSATEWPSVVRVVRTPDAERLVSVVIPTRGSSGVVLGTHRTFVVEAVRSMVARSTYTRLEFVVVYDTATPPTVLDELRAIAGGRLVLVEFAAPFDFSAKLDLGVEATSGELVLLLNDDTELIDPDAVTTLVGHLDDPGVAMVGAKLLFEDGRLQHGGHVYHGDIHHACFGWPGDSPGPAPLHPLAVARETSGVTAGCALVRRSAFAEVGGLDRAFPHNYNDVDFSLKLRAAGHRIVWTPWARWFHFESRSRQPDVRPEERALIDARWHAELRSDPYYHPALPAGPADWRPPASPVVAARAPSLARRMRSFAGRVVLRRTSRRPSGVNLIGYFRATSGLGDRVRELERVLAAAGIRCSCWDFDLTESARVADDRAVRGDDGVIFDTTIAVVTALAFPALPGVYPPLVNEVDRVIGYWFWELARIPASHRPAIDLVDEIWAPSGFVRDAYAAATDLPVRRVPLPVRQPAPSGLDRTGFGFDERFVFVTSFDHLSSMERKHPIGVVDAFQRAFGDRDDVRLVVKSINGHLRPDQTATLVERIGDDDRIEVRDGYLSAGDHAALLAAADCYVSLHRSEGLGLHIAEAMWLGTPVIATDYSGSVDLTSPRDDRPVAELVPYRLAPVEGGGEAYTTGEWADPELGAASDAMRRIVADPAHRAALAAAAAEHVARTPDAAQSAALVRSLLAARETRPRDPSPARPPPLRQNG